MMAYEFGDYLLTEDGELSYKDESIEIPPKELSLLYVLLNANGSLLSKDEIIEKVWHGASISDESLTRCIYGLRRVLGNNKHYIRTFYSRGYRFSPPYIKKRNLSEVKKMSFDGSILSYSYSIVSEKLDFSYKQPSTIMLTTKKVINQVGN
ncbi:winged helix-turn-helix domain-containing protein [Serratia liquefaciens]|uniref:winged helix-turn-helix domain-containing protein n=1 Tax=Serratia liquefaciens TaxID=614 RepID=UPI002157AD7B|nr:winged helix-turn-helix domain-containing protein [Serratia liquefaciens]